jgi:hypothetical protein
MHNRNRHGVLRPSKEGLVAPAVSGSCLPEERGYGASHPLRAETLYSKLGSDFVDAHKRGADPATAPNEMSARLGDLQGTIARILR